jgi:acetyltransferase
MAEGGQLTTLSNETISRLDEVLPATWSHRNPIDIIGDATGARYAAALDILLEQPETTALLILNCPTALASSDDVATAVMETLPADLNSTVLTAWTGEHSTRKPRQRLQRHGIPIYDTPEDAVHAFVQMVNFQRNQAMLMETPPSLPEVFEPDQKAAEAVIDGVLTTDRSWLTEPEAKQVLSAYGIPTVKTIVADSPAEVGVLAKGFNTPLVIKILSTDITHKSDVGGVVLDVPTQQAESAARAMLGRVRWRKPEAKIDGFTVQPMVRRPNAHELIVGMIDDRQFGPVILFGHGGTAVEVIDDKALALPPLNMKLAIDLISRTQIYKLLSGYRDVAAANIDEIAMTLVRLSHLISDLPTIKELDINPLLADADGVVALDARIKVASAESSGADRLAIRPYPTELEEDVKLNDDSEYLIRPVVPEDEPFISAAFYEVSELMSARFTQIDYDRQMALVLTDHGAPGTQDIYGVVRLVEGPDRVQAEVVIAIVKPFVGRGMGNALMRHIINYARRRGIKKVRSIAGATDERLLNLYKAHGFSLSDEVDEFDQLQAELNLN